MRYGVALLTAALLIAAISLFAWLTKRQLEVQIRQDLRQQSVNTDAVYVHDSYVRISVGQQFQMDLSRLLTSSWYVWAPMVIAVCLACASLVGWLRERRA